MSKLHFLKNQNFSKSFFDLRIDFLIEKSIFRSQKTKKNWKHMEKTWKNDCLFYKIFLFFAVRNFLSEFINFLVTENFRSRENLPDGQTLRITRKSILATKIYMKTVIVPAAFGSTDFRSETCVKIFGDWKLFEIFFLGLFIFPAGKIL